MKEATMSDTQDTQTEQHVGLTKPDAFEQTTSDESVTGKHLFADGGHGQEKEAVTLSPHAGASSDAPANSGIPSAERQHSVNQITQPQEGTSLPDHTLPTHQNLEP
jgi:hypothetical protein